MFANNAKRNIACPVRKGSFCNFMKNIFKENPSKDDDDEKKGAALILELIDKNGLWLFHDQLNNAYAALDGDGATVMRIDSQKFSQWLFNFVYEETGKVSNEASCKAAMKVMKYKAEESNLFELGVRVALFNGAIWYDLGGKNFIRIDEQGWSLNEAPQPVIFKRFGHQKVQTLPERGGTIDAFMDFVNLRDKNEQLLLLVYLVAAFIPNFPHPVLVVHGSQGSAKSTVCKLVKDLVDPSALETSSINDDKDIKELVQAASHHWLLVLDNLSYISEKTSDVISRICTGGGLTKRIQYTNDDDFIYNFRHIVAINGVHQIVSKPDLLDRSILLALERIPEEKRMTEEQLWNRFNAVKPQLLGAIFSTVSGALHEYQNVQLSAMPRMADFARWGCAVARSLGHTEEDFMRVYQANIGRQNQEALSASATAAVIIKFMESKDDFQDTPSELLRQLDPIADDLKVKDAKDYPRQANWLWRRLEAVIPNLATAGLKVEQEKDKERKIKITKIRQGNDSTDSMSSGDVEAKVPAKDSTDSKDSISSPDGFFGGMEEEERR